MKKQKKIWNKIIFIIGLLLVSYPLVSSMIERQHQKDAVATYQGSIEEEDKSRIQDAIAKASEYNNMLFQTQGASIGDLQNGILSEENYENLLNLSGTGVMGSIEIPKINVDIPIYHGTSEEVLASGVGHFQDSSLPVGGNNTRCILTGHRGLPNSKLFTSKLILPTNLLSSIYITFQPRNHDHVNILRCYFHLSLFHKTFGCRLYSYDFLIHQVHMDIFLPYVFHI